MGMRSPLASFLGLGASVLVLSLSAATTASAGSPSLPDLPMTPPAVAPLTRQQVQKLFPGLTLFAYRWKGGGWSYVTADPNNPRNIVPFKGTHLIRIDVGWDDRAAYQQKLHDSSRRILHWTFFHGGKGFARGGFGSIYEDPSLPNQPVELRFEFPGSRYWGVSIDVYRPLHITPAHLMQVATSLRNVGEWG